MVSGDAVLLERALANLIGNALEATARGGRPLPVEVSVQRIENWVEVVIADRGAGIPSELRDRLFRPFVSGHPGGVGLGLAVSRRIVDLHGGSISLDDRPGGGALARLRLPAADAERGGEDVTFGSESPAAPDGGSSGPFG